MWLLRLNSKFAESQMRCGVNHFRYHRRRRQVIRFRARSGCFGGWIKSVSVTDDYRSQTSPFGERRRIHAKARDAGLGRCSGRVLPIFRLGRCWRCCRDDRDRGISSLQDNVAYQGLESSTLERRLSRYVFVNALTSITRVGVKAAHNRKVEVGKLLEDCGRSDFLCKS